MPCHNAAMRRCLHALPPQDERPHRHGSAGSARACPSTRESTPAGFSLECAMPTAALAALPGLKALDLSNNDVLVSNPANLGVRLHGALSSQTWCGRCDARMRLKLCCAAATRARAGQSGGHHGRVGSHPLPRKPGPVRQSPHSGHVHACEHH